MMKVSRGDGEGEEKEEEKTIRIVIHCISMKKTRKIENWYKVNCTTSEKG